MKICDLFNEKKPVVSFEIFPPKPTFPIESIYKTIEGLQELNPDFISITYGAGGSSSRRTIEIADMVKNIQGIETLVHLTCVGSARSDIDHIFDTLQSKNIDNILALRGDPPIGTDTFVETQGGYKYAKDLIRHIKTRDNFCIASAAYPEGHLECRNLEKDIYYLKEKIDCGTDFLITQLFFDNDIYYQFLDRAKEAGINCPISVGIMPVLNVNQIARITSLCGASIPVLLKNIMDRYGSIPADMEKAGIEYACDQISDLVKNKVDGIHLYTMNKADQAKIIMKQTNLRR